jgi:hypothetical protein
MFMNIHSFEIHETMKVPSIFCSLAQINCIGLFCRQYAKPFVADSQTPSLILTRNTISLPIEEPLINLICPHLNCKNYVHEHSFMRNTRSDKSY